MTPARVVLRSTRALRSQPIRQVRPRRYQSTESSSSSAPSPGNNGSSALYGGIAGGAVTFLGGYAWYHFSGAKSFVNTAHQTKAYFDSVVEKSKESAPPAKEAVQWLRQQAGFYAGFIPGGQGYVDSAFNDLDAIHKKHGGEVDKIVSEAYDELKETTSKGLSVDTAATAWNILQKHLKRIAELAGDASQDILNNHPEIKEKVGGNIDNLKSMGEQFGPQAQKMVDDTWSQIQDIIKGGISVTSIDKIRKLVQEKTEQVQKLGDQAWKKGMDEMKPYLDKTPKVKELIEENIDSLKSGNMTELWQKIKQAADSGNISDLENFVTQTAKDASSKAGGGGGGGGLEQYLDMVPGGSEILPKLSQLSEISQKHGKEAEKLFKDTIKEVQDVLAKKVDEGKKLAEKAGGEAKS